MKTFLMTLLFVITLTGSAVADIAIDISGSQVEITDPTTIRIRNLTAPGYPGRYWADLRWNPSSLVFEPLGAGVETAPPARSWTVTIDLPGELIEITLKTDPDAGRLLLAVTATQGSPFFAIGWMEFSQAGKKFVAAVSPSQVDAGTALFHGDSGWNGEGQLSTGQTRSGTIDNLPAWFDFGAPLTFNVAGMEVYLK